MAVLQIVGDRARAGKTSLAGALLLHLTQTGRKAAYFKPFSINPQDDADVAFFSRYLPDGAASLETYTLQLLPSPLNTDGPPQPEALAGDIAQVVAQLQDQCDLVLVESPDLFSSDGATSTLPLDLSALLDSTVLCLFRYSPQLNTDGLAAVAQPFGDRLSGVIINGVTAYRTQHVKETLANELRDRGVGLHGTVPEDRSMLGLTIQQIADFLGGRWVQDPENTDAQVERFLIGGNIMDRGATYFGRHANQAVITRGARPDIQMASLMSGVCCLILTGGDEPTEYVKAEALQRGVPLILVESNTMETLEGLGGLLDSATAHSQQKIERFLSLLRDNLDVGTLVPPLD